MPKSAANARIQISAEIDQTSAFNVRVKKLGCKVHGFYKLCHFQPKIWDTSSAPKTACIGWIL